MTELEALMHFKSLFDKASNVTTEHYSKHNNIKLLHLMIDSQLATNKPSYSMIRDFLLNVCPIKDIISENKLPSIEQLREPGAVEKYWSFPE